MDSDEQQQLLEVEDSNDQNIDSDHDDDESDENQDESSSDEDEEQQEKDVQEINRLQQEVNSYVNTNVLLTFCIRFILGIIKRV